MVRWAGAFRRTQPRVCPSIVHHGVHTRRFCCYQSRTPWQRQTAASKVSYSALVSGTLTFRLSSVFMSITWLLLRCMRNSALAPIVLFCARFRDKGEVPKKADVSQLRGLISHASANNYNYSSGANNEI
jgi:hypothetical protein